MRPSLKRNTIRLLLVFIFLAAWQILSGPVFPIMFFSSPYAILVSLIHTSTVGFPNSAPIPLYEHIWVTLYETLAGFGLAAATGVLTGVLLGINRGLSETVDPFIYALYAIPKIALAPLFILWFGFYAPSKIFMSFIVAYFIIFYATYGGVINVSNELINVLRIMRASRRDIILKIILPSAYPYIFIGFRTGLPLALVGAVVGEFLASNAGLGFMINYSTEFFDTAGVFAGILILTALAIAMDYAFRALQSKLLKWQPTTSIST